MGVGTFSGGSWRLSWEGVGRHVGRCWFEDGIFWNILGEAVPRTRETRSYSATSMAGDCQGWPEAAGERSDGRRGWGLGGSPLPLGPLAVPGEGFGEKDFQRKRSHRKEIPDKTFWKEYWKVIMENLLRTPSCPLKRAGG